MTLYMYMYAKAELNCSLVVVLWAELAIYWPAQDLGLGVVAIDCSEP